MTKKLTTFVIQVFLIKRALLSWRIFWNCVNQVRRSHIRRKRLRPFSQPARHVGRQESQISRIHNRPNGSHLQKSGPSQLFRKCLLSRTQLVRRQPDRTSTSSGLEREKFVRSLSLAVDPLVKREEYELAAYFLRTLIDQDTYAMEWTI